ncbi:MAG: YfhO family protein, partial [Marinoscillum sp.]
SAPYFAGVIPILLFVLSFFVLPKRQTIWVSALVLLGIVLSWGKNFETINYLLYDYLPLYSKFRSVTFTIIISIFGIYLLGFQGLQVWMDSETKKKETLLKAIGVCGGLALLFLIFGGMFSFHGSVDENLPDWFVTALRADRQSMLQKGAFKALVFILLSGGLLWMYLQKKVSNLMLASGLMVLTSIDMVSEAKRFIKSENFKRNAIEEELKATAADDYINGIAKPGERVLNLQNPFNDARTSYFHESIGGYHGAKMRRYQDLISHCLNTELSDIITNLQAGKRSFNTPALNMLNAKYFVAGAAKNAVLTNTQAFGNAWFASDITYVNNPDEEIAGTCNLAGRTAIIDQSKFSIKPSVGSGSIQLLEKTPNSVTYEANATIGGLAVFSEIYYPKGWTVFIDDDKVDLLRANYILRAVEIPKGSHKIAFHFTPESYKTGQLVTTTSSILFGLLFLGFIVGFIRKKDA